MFFTNEKDDLVDLVKISPKYLKISTGGETNINPSFDPDSTNEDADYRLWAMTKQSLDLNNQPCLNFDIWKSISNVERAKVTNRLRFAIYERDNYRCKKCGSTENLEIDHIIPIFKGGKSTYSNLQTLCHKCNTEKGSKIEIF